MRRASTPCQASTREPASRCSRPWPAACLWSARARPKTARSAKALRQVYRDVAGVSGAAALPGLSKPPELALDVDGAAHRSHPERAVAGQLPRAAPGPLRLATVHPNLAEKNSELS